MTEFDPDRQPPMRDAAVDSVTAEAVHWFAALREKPEDRDLQVRLASWLSRDARHAAAFDSIARHWQMAGGLLADAASQIDTLGATRRRAEMSRRNFGRLALAASVGAVAVGAGSIAVRSHLFADYRTAAGETGTFRLPDGSDLELSTASAASLAFDTTTRRVILHAGEAFLRVATDPAARPFVVAAAGGDVIALGTAFAVRVQAERARVIVTEHAVEVKAGGDVAQVRAGEQVDYDRNGIAAAAPADATGALAWRQGRLVFDAVPLGEVLATLDQWRHGRVLLLDDVLAQKPVTLIVDTQRTDAALAALTQVLPIELVSITPYLTLIMSAA